MALIQTGRGNVRFTGSFHSPVSIRQLAEQIAHLSEQVFAFVQRRLGRLAQWWGQRRASNGLTMAERARQRRELEQLSDRELRDIGITRYEIDFVLRHSRQERPPPRKSRSVRRGFDRRLIGAATNLIASAAAWCRCGIWRV